MSDPAALPSVARFAGIAQAYARYRPSYPSGAIRAILNGLPSNPYVLDVGAGTGISAQALRDAGARVVALEPNEEMRALAAAGGLEAREGTALATGFADRSVDAVTAFQAFHWFATDAALAEFRRILRLGGRLAIVWNERDRTDAFSNEYRELEERHGERTMLAGANFVDFADGALVSLIERNGFQNVRYLAFPNGQRLDEEHIVGRVRSLSYAPKAGPALDAFVADVRALHARHRDRDGSATLRLRTDVFLGDVPE